MLRLTEQLVHILDIYLFIGNTDNTPNEKLIARCNLEWSTL